MSWIEWNDALSVGVEEIDKQHKKLIEILNLLYDSIQEGKEKLVIEKIIKELLDYTKYHFTSEENYFKKLQYHDVQKHIEAHKRFIRDINKFQNDYMEKKEIISSEILEYLKDWLINHIMIDDQSYGPYFIKL